MDKNFKFPNCGWTIGQYDQQNSPLHLAAMFGSLISNVIVQNVETKNPGQTPLHYAAQFNHLKVCELIIKNISNKSLIKT